MEHFEEMEMKLWEYIDGLSIPSEKSAIEKLIAENTEWRNKYQELTEAHQLMQSTELEEPSLRFTKNVMEEIAKFHVAPAAKKYLNNKVIWGIGIFFIVTILGFVIYGVAQVIGMKRVTQRAHLVLTWTNLILDGCLITPS